MRSDFSRIISILRKERNISQKQASDDLEISQALLSHYEKGAREPKLSFVIRVADYYNVSCDYLLGRTLEKTGGALKAHQIEDTSLEKDNVVKGTVASLIQKKLLLNSIGLIMDIAGSSKNNELVSAVSSYFYFPIYKSYRYLSAGLENPNMFNVSEDYFDLLCDAEQKVREVRIKSLAKNDLKMNPNQKEVAFSDLSPEALSVAYPRHAPSLFSIVQSASDAISLTTNPHTKIKPKK